MKRVLSLVLTLTMVLGLLAGLGITASAEYEAVALQITAPAAGEAVSADVTGLPEGFQVENVVWQKYNYTDGNFEDYTEAAFADNSVYRMIIYMKAETVVMPWEYDATVAEATVNGEKISGYSCGGMNADGINYIEIQKQFVLGNIQVIDTVTVEQMPACEPGASTDRAQFVLPSDANYTIAEHYWYSENGNYEEAALSNGVYYLSLWLVPADGCWFAENLAVNAPIPEPDVFCDGNSAQLSFTYDTREKVAEVQLTGLPEISYGADVSAESIVGADDAYTIEAVWYDENYNEAQGKFHYGDYYLELHLYPAEGAYFADDVTVTVDGMDVTEISEGLYCSEDVINFGIHYTVDPENGYVVDIGISGAPGEIEANAAISTPTLAVTEGKVSITKTQWVDEDYAPVTGKFADGKVYYLEITIKAEEGYGLRSGYYSEVERKDDGYDHPYQKVNEDGTATIYVRYSLCKQIDKIEVTYTEPAVGKAPAEPKVPDGAKYTITEYHWYDNETGNEFETFEEGKVYYLDVYIQLTEGYETANNVTFLVNGEETYDYGHEETTANLWLRVSFKKQIDRIDITMPEPELGGEANVEDITVPQDANYSICDGNWNAYNTEFNGVFGKDKYELYLQLDANEGYEFAEEIEIYINGELYDESYAYNNYMSTEMYYQVSFREKISKVEIPQLPTAKVGEEAVIPTIEAPEGANYSIMAVWMEYQGGLSGEPFTGTFADKSVYYLAVNAVPNLGYEFSEDVVFTVGGEAYTGLKMVSEDGIICMKLNNLGLTEIKKVELTVEEPEIGKAPGKLTASEDANYEITEQDWTLSETDDVMDAENVGKKDVFAEGKYYWIAGMLRAKEGCIFAEDVQITVNGEAIDASVIEEIVGFSVFADIAFYVYGFEKLEAPAPVVPPVAGNPETGDMQIAAMAALVIVSMAAVAVTVINKKKFFA